MILLLWFALWAPAVDTDAGIVQQVEAMDLATRRLFLTGRLDGRHPIHALIGKRVRAQVHALASRAPEPLRIQSRQRLFAEQSNIVRHKLQLTGSFASGWDTLPERYYTRRRVNRVLWESEPPSVRFGIIFRYSALPGASRHHWGTDVDFNSALGAHWGPGGKYVRLGAWLERNARSAGFAQVYTPGRAAGHANEPWHYSYLPLAAEFYRMYLRDVRVRDDVLAPMLADWRRQGRLPTGTEAALDAIRVLEYVQSLGL